MLSHRTTVSGYYSLLICGIMIFQSHIINGKLQTKSSCTFDLANASEIFNYDGREITVKNTDSLTEFCQTLLFVEDFPTDQCVTDIYPSLQSGRLPIKPELYRQFAAVSLQRMTIENDRPFIVDPTLKSFTAPAKIYNDIAMALTQLKIEKADSFCYASYTLKSTLLTNLNGYKFIQKLRQITSRAKGKLIFFPGQLSPLGLIPDDDVRFWSAQLLSDHNTKALAINLLKSKMSNTKSNSIAATPATTTTTTTTISSSGKAEPILTTERAAIISAVTARSTTAKIITSVAMPEIINLDTPIYNASITAEISRYKSVVSGTSDEDIFESLNILRRLPPGTNLKKPTIIDPSTQAAFDSNPIFDRGFTRDSEGSGKEDSLKGTEQDQTAGIRSLKDAVEKLDAEFAVLDNTLADGLLGVITRLAALEAAKVTMTDALATLLEDLITTQKQVTSLEDCCDECCDESSSSGNPDAWWKLLWTGTCCSLGLMLSLIGLLLTITTWSIYIIVHCINGSCKVLNGCLGICCQGLLEHVCCCTCKRDCTLCGLRCHDSCYDEVPSREGSGPRSRGAMPRLPITSATASNRSNIHTSNIERADSEEMGLKDFRTLKHSKH